MNNKKVKYSTLQKKKRFWQNLLGLRDWKIQVRFVSSVEIMNPKDRTEHIIALLKTCEPIEKVAVIVIREDYYKDEDCGIIWNIDTVLLHEFIHILLSERIDLLSQKIQNNKRFRDLEEFICDLFAKTIYDLVKRKKR